MRTSRVAELQRINPDWAGEPCIVAAPGPSLTADVVRQCRMARWLRGWRIIAVQDAYKLMPFADAMYGCDVKWWSLHKNCAGFTGEKWSTHEDDRDRDQDKLSIADEYGLRCVRGMDGDEFSFDPEVIRYVSNSGAQAIGLALLKGCRRIVLVGFDMRSVDGKQHFFGDHPAPMHNRTDYEVFIPHFERAAATLPDEVRIVNATPDSALRCWPMMDLEAALAEDFRGPDNLPDRHRPVVDTDTDRGCAA